MTATLTAHRLTPALQRAADAINELGREWKRQERAAKEANA